MGKWLIKNGTFLTMDEKRPMIKGSMVIEDDRIKELTNQNVIDESVFSEIVDGTGKLFMPGLVNTHNHAAMSLLRGIGDDLALQVWLQEKMWPNEAKFTAQDVKWGSLLSITEMIKSGTTSFVDMYDHMDEVAKAVEEAGMRARLTRGMIALGCNDAEQNAKLQEAVQFAKDWHLQANGRITVMMAPHSPYTCPPSFIEKVVAASAELDLPVHTHMSETAKEVEDNVKEYGLRPVMHLSKLGVFDRPCIIAHGVHLTDEEIDILCSKDVRISHNPGSNLKLASGIARVPELLKAGILVSLGTDGPASNNNLDMFEEMRLAALIHKGVSGDPTAVPATEALKMGTVYGAESIWLDQVGQLKEGYKADLIALDIEQSHLYPKSDYASHVIYSASGHDVTDVWVDGKRLMKNRELLTLDEEKIRFEAQSCYDRLMAT
ncbi:amidohydrolase [Marinicrinis lubricantis]|uniref:5-methylthioadenosine/S-adenosylhomocysteine deaminase n=1 Tax=Marinicrinis lubricantis TaxID=2086470 RepID=A0ABW1ILX4_9BACL